MKFHQLKEGASAKAGVRYEYLWTVMRMTRVLRGEADWIHLEPPGEEGEGVEFLLSAASGTEYHQVKLQLTGKGAWSLRELIGDKGIAKEIPVEPFDEETVKSLVAGMGMDAGKFISFQLDGAV